MLAGIGFARNIALPQTIKTKLSTDYSKFNNIIFRCGGKNNGAEPTEYCAASIFNSHEFHKSQTQTITEYDWELPSFPHKTSSNYVLYSDKEKNYGALVVLVNKIILIQFINWHLMMNLILNKRNGNGME